MREERRPITTEAPDLYATVGLGHAFAATILGKLDEMIELLEQPHTELAFGGGPSGEQQMENWPVAGRMRTVVSSRSGGGIYQVQTTITDVIDFDKGRAGLSIVNIGSFPCYVYLSKAGDAASGGAPTGYLAANGAGEFDGKITDALWCGPISAQGIGGATQLAVAII